MLDCFDYYSVRWRTSLGRSTLLREEENIGITRKQSKALGICQTFTELLLRRLRLLQRRQLRKSRAFNTKRVNNSDEFLL